MKRALILMVVMATLSGSGYAQAKLTCAVVPKTLDAMKDCYRPLLVFSANGDDARLKRQVARLDEAADDMMDRFVLFAPIVPDGHKVSTPADSPYTILSPEAMKGVRTKFHIPAAEFVVILLDEDGSVMLRSRIPVDADRLNAVIDKTPRRQAEAHRPHAN
ncbi:MAG TPA: DUF4174 domain-containing protein [Acidobacteriaceae bacterium]|nr:DUF4174 domain-containing protein [Acidobacteriaceae bacterium]